jgi:DNA polymerase
VEGSYLKLVEEIKRCTKCPLHKSRKNAVPGEGPLDADVMVVGEGPGRNEDEQGRPFVGAAGKLLTELLEAAGLPRESVYITNVVKCRPPGNRDPADEEIVACLPYLLAQIRLVRPKLIIAVGRHAARTLLQLSGRQFRSMARDHGKVYEATIEGVRVRIIPTYHPAAALYKPQLRQDLERDFRTVIAAAVSQLASAGKGKGEAKAPGRTLLDYLGATQHRTSTRP